MARRIRYADFAHETTLRERRVRFGELAAPAGRIRLQGKDVYRLVAPYVSVRFAEQLKAVVPLALYLVAFQMLILRQAIADSWIVTAGLFAVVAGLMMFMEGLKLGLMPFGESMGRVLPAKSPLSVVLAIAFLLGVGVTFAEPAIGALKAAGATVRSDEAPLLADLLGGWSDALVLVVGVGVGLAAVIGTVRFLYGWSLKPLIYAVLLPALGLTLYASSDPLLSRTLGLAWDCGAVTTGPVTVPLVLALGVGVASTGGRGDTSLSGFGIVTLASLFPVLGVMMLALYASGTSGEGIAPLAPPLDPPWYETTPGVEVVLALRAIVPLVVFLFLVMKVVLREPIRDVGTTAYGIVLAVLGMVVFNLGLTYGLSKLGGQAGGLVPAAFAPLAGVEGTPLYSWGLGIGAAVAFALVLGFGATLAEPALNALGLTVEKLTDGAFRKSLLMYAVAGGVGFGIALGVVKVLFDIPIAFLVVPGYGLALVLTAVSSEEFVNVAWDSAGVTTGPVTVPLVLAMGLGFGGALGSVEGFGILAMASVGPIVSVLGVGLATRWMARRRHRLVYEAEEEME